MSKREPENVCPGLEMKCPGCHRPLTVPRISVDENKPLICGGCGERFNCGDLESAPPDAK